MCYSYRFKRAYTLCIYSGRKTREVVPTFLRACVCVSQVPEKTLEFVRVEINSNIYMDEAATGCGGVDSCELRVLYLRKSVSPSYSLKSGTGVVCVAV